jgi:hypothetical protein
LKIECVDIIFVKRGCQLYTQKVITGTPDKRKEIPFFKTKEEKFGSAKHLTGLK